MRKTSACMAGPGGNPPFAPALRLARAHPLRQALLLLLQPLDARAQRGGVPAAAGARRGVHAPAAQQYAAAPGGHAQRQAQQPPRGTLLLSPRAPHSAATRAASAALWASTKAGCSSRMDALSSATPGSYPSSSGTWARGGGVAGDVVPCGPALVANTLPAGRRQPHTHAPAAAPRRASGIVRWCPTNARLPSSGPCASSQRRTACAASRSPAASSARKEALRGRRDG